MRKQKSQKIPQSFDIEYFNTNITSLKKVKIRFELKRKKSVLLECYRFIHTYTLVYKTCKKSRIKQDLSIRYYIVNCKK